MKLALDHYTLHTRLFSSFLVLLPLGLLFLAWFPTSSIWEGAVKTLGVPVVLSALLSQLGRDLGKKKEPTLFVSWGGMPTDRFLSAVSTSLDRDTLFRYQTKLTVLIPGIRFPDKAEEAVAPLSALQVYRSCTNFLREQTRDRVRFPLVFAENLNYGFRRNLWAMKPAGILIAAIASIGSLLPIFVAPTGVNYPTLVVAVVLNVCLFVFWIFRINREWVRVPAEEYARQLFAACEVL